MKKILSLFVFCSIIVVVVFLLFGDLEHKFGVDLQSQATKFNYAVLSFFVMVSDIILPVPSSLVMILNGKILGVVLGSLLSFISGLISSFIGFLLGNISSPYLNKLFSTKDIQKGNRMFEKFGLNVIIISKALPIISEVISFISGTTKIPLNTFLLYSAIGHLIISVIYAFAGNYATAVNSNLISAIIIGLVIFISWLMQVIIKPSKDKSKQ